MTSGNHCISRQRAYRRTCLSLQVMVLAISLALPLTGWAGTPSMPVSAVFYQPHTNDLRLPPSWWQEKFNLLKRYGIHTLYIQWSRHGAVDFFQETEKGRSSLLDELFRLARQHHMRILVGLYADPDFFTRIKQPDIALEVYLKRLRLFSLEQADKIVRLMADEPPFGGVYIYEEIDDVNWRDTGRQELLKAHLDTLAAQLAQRFPGKEVALSTFFTGQMAPAAFAALWERLLRDNAIRLLVQDGAGTGKLDGDERLLYLQALNRRLPPDRWSVIMEIFQQGPDHRFTPQGQAMIHLKKRVQQLHRLDVERPVLFSLRYLPGFEQLR